MRKFICLIAAVFFAAMLALVPGAVAQQERAPQQQPDKNKPDEATLPIDTDLVAITATVTDQRGRYAANLKQQQFALYEDGVKQEIAYFNSGDRVPISLGITFDTSGSMVDKIDDVRDAVEHFVQSVAPGDEIFLVRFSNEAELVQDFTDDRRRILRAVERLYPRGSTALYDAILMGLERVNEGKHRKRALMVVTDGNDTTSAADFNAALALARKSEVIIYALGIGHSARGSFGHGGIFGRQSKDAVDMRVLRAFAEATGGEAFHLENAHAGGRDLVDEAAAQVAAELKPQYLLGYYPTNTRRDGAFRQIKVETTDKSLRVRARRGYYAGRDNNQ